MSSIALTLGDWLQYAAIALSPLLLAPLVILATPRIAGPFQLVSDAICAVSRRLLNLAGWLGLLMAAGMLANVMMRYVYGVGFGWAKDIWVYAFAGSFMLASAGALRDSAHVRVDILFSRMSLKQRAVIDICGAYLFLLPLMALILNAYAPQLANAWGAATGRLELSKETDGLPMLFLFKTLVPVFAASMLLQGWANTIRAACVLRDIPTKAPALAINEEPHA